MVVILRLCLLVMVLFFTAGDGLTADGLAADDSRHTGANTYENNKPESDTGPDAPQEIIAKVWDYMRGKTSYSLVRMTVHRPEWERQTIIKVWTRGREDSIFKIVSPAKDKDNGTLKLGREMWTYNPRINRVVKIPPSMMSQSWMGSDFSNNDLSKADSILEDYTHEITGTYTRDGHTIYEITSMPKQGAPVVWGMQKLTLRDDGILLRQSFHDEDYAVVKQLSTEDIKMLGGRAFPRRWIMQSFDTEKENADEYTLLEYDELEFGVELNDSMFTLNALRKPVR